MKLKNNDKWLFKYMPFNENALKLLINGEFWFAGPDYQNDSFECEFNLKYDHLPLFSHEVSFPLNSELKENIFNGNKEQNLSDLVAQDEFHSMLKGYLKSAIGICSFTYIMDNILMWSHYADSNSGICLAFNRDKLMDDENFKVDHFDVVKYDINTPEVNFRLDDNGQGILGSNDIFFSQKNKVWKYEKEYRAVRLYGPPNAVRKNTVPFAKDILEGIILGEKFNEKANLDTIKNIINNTREFKNVELYIAVKNKRKNGFDIKGQYMFKLSHLK
jgi:hypothetical protein